MMSDVIDWFKAWREFREFQRLQRAADEAEIHKACWDLRAKHRERDLNVLARSVLGPRG